MIDKLIDEATAVAAIYLARTDLTPFRFLPERGEGSPEITIRREKNGCWSVTIHDQCINTQRVHREGVSVEAALIHTISLMRTWIQRRIDRAAECKRALDGVERTFEAPR